MAEKQTGIFAGDGEMPALMRAHDWAAGPLGPVERWPENLRTTVRICLASRFPLVVWWGPDLVMLYNDAYRPILGASKHPGALGRRGRERWPEIWDVIGPMLEGVLTRAEATWSDDQLLLLDRNGYVEECYFTFSYSPIRDDAGGVEGVFTAVTETTGRVLGERRLATLRDLAARVMEAREVEAACRLAASTLASNPHDLPFALLYLLEDGGAHARLVGAAGIAAATPAAPPRLALCADAPGWPLAGAAASGGEVIVEDLAARFGPLPGGAWPDPPGRAAILPVTLPGQAAPTLLLVAALSPRLVYDAPYRDFLRLVAGQIATAVTTARAHEEERRRAEALAELDRAKTAFFSNVSHEFRTPLTLALAPIEDALADSEQPLPPRQHERLAIAHRNALRLLRLVNTLLDFSRIEAGRLQASYEPADLAALTADLASMFRSVVERAGLRLVVDCPPLPEPVYVDRDMWEKIVLNLLSNAFKFTFEGQIAVRLRAAGGRATLEVRDTGTGIPAADLPHIFERFYRVRDARGRTHEGSGIGLALVRELIALHGGAIGVESAVGAGTTITASLPLGTAHLPAERIGTPRAPAPSILRAAPYVDEALRWLPEAPPPAGVPGLAAEMSAALGGTATGAAGARVLLADDNADMRAYLRRLLGERYTVEAVADGAAALAAALAHPPDLVLADVMMPGLDGFALVRALRADPRTCTIPIVLLSARAGEEARVEGLDAGADDYLVKPFGARELLARVGSHLALARARREARDALAAERDRLQQVLDTLPEGVSIVDAEGRIAVTNQAGRDLIGRDTRGQPLPRTDPEVAAAYGLRHSDSTPYAAADQPLARALRDGAVVRGEQILVRNAATGQVIPLLASCAPLRGPGGAITGAVAVFQDITSLKELERQRHEFLTTASHDLKNPLTSILGMGQVLQRRVRRIDAAEAAGLAEGLETITRTASRMAGQINELMDSIQLRMGAALELDPRPVDLAALLARLVAEESQAGEQHTLRLDAPAGPLLGLYDGPRLERALRNVLGNAIKYSPAGGPVAVALSHQDGPSGAWATIRVSDRGLGIPAAEVGRVFDRFYRASNVVGRIEGTGIGLAGVRQIVEQHGGTIALESEEGVGTTVTIRLPHRPPEGG